MRHQIPLSSCVRVSAKGGCNYGGLGSRRSDGRARSNGRRWSDRRAGRRAPSPRALRVHGLPLVAMLLTAGVLVGLGAVAAYATAPVSFQNRPQSFSPNGDGTDDVLSVDVHLGEASNLTLVVQNKDGGSTVATLTSNQSFSAGTQNLGWDGRDDAGAIVPGGDYVISATAVGPDGEEEILDTSCETVTA